MAIRMILSNEKLFLLGVSAFLLYGLWRVVEEVIKQMEEMDDDGDVE